MWNIPLAGKKYVITIKEIKSCRWWKKLFCFFFGYLFEPCPSDKSSEQFCSKGCGG